MSKGSQLASSLLLIFLLSLRPASGQDTLGIATVTPVTALRQSMIAANKELVLNRIQELLDGQFTDRFNSTRKFTIVAVKDLNELLKAQERVTSGIYDPNDKMVPQLFKIAGTKYLLLSTIDDFDSLNESKVFEGGQRTMTRRTVRLSVVAKVYDSSSGKLLESANFQINTNDVSEITAGHVQDGTAFDSLFVAVARDMAEKVANRVIDVVYPARVLAKTKQQLTINRGEGAGVAIDQVWNVYGLGEELIDPDTKASLGREEVLVGKAKITSINPRTSIAEVLSDSGIEKGSILRLPAAKSAP